MLLVGAALLASTGCGGEDSTPPEAPPQAAPERPAAEAGEKPPNLIVVMTDDQTLPAYSREAMPYIHRFFERGGTNFASALAVPPLCCPARAGFITGQYAHNHGVLTNDPGYQTLREEESVLPEWLRGAGYRTSVIGKFMNGFPGITRAGPPGWDEWFIGIGEVGYFDFEVSTGGEIRRYDSGEYATEVYTEEARRFAARARRDGQPFFLWLSYNAPHTVPDAAPPCAGRMPEPPSRRAFERFADAPLPTPPHFDEPDVSDKGPAVSSRRPLGGAARAELELRWRCTLASLRAVDRGFRSLVAALRERDLLDETLIAFVSDNGFFFGEHRLRQDKHYPYDPALRVPLAIKPPGGRDGGEETEALVSTVDLAPTLLDYAGARPCRDDECRTVDGRSLRPLLEGAEGAWPADRAIPIELDDRVTYSALRTPEYLYLELSADPRGELDRPRIELYDLRRDPHQLENVWASDRERAQPLRRDLAQRLRRATRCAGTGTDAANPCD